MKAEIQIRLFHDPEPRFIADKDRVLDLTLGTTKMEPVAIGFFDLEYEHPASPILHEDWIFAQLEELWMATQHIDHSWCSVIQEPWSSMGDPRETRSTSVGDYVEIRVVQGKPAPWSTTTHSVWICASFGWECVWTLKQALERFEERKA